MSAQHLKQLNTPGLFDSAQQEESDFLSRIDEVDEFANILSVTHTSMIQEWVREYTAFKKNLETLKKAIDTYNAFVEETPIFGLRTDPVYSWSLGDLEVKTQRETMLEDKDHLLTTRIKTFVEEEWGVVLSAADMGRKIDFLSTQSICGYIAEETNYGNAEVILREQNLASFAQAWKHTDFELKNKKVVAIEAFYFSKHDIEYGYIDSRYRDKLKSLRDLLKLYHSKNTTLSYSSIDACFSHYRSNKVVGLFEKIEEGDKNNKDILMSTKIYKNGKFEIEFMDVATAKSFYDEFVNTALKQQGESSC